MKFGMGFKFCWVIADEVAFGAGMSAMGFYMTRVDSPKREPLSTFFTLKRLFSMNLLNMNDKFRFAEICTCTTWLLASKLSWLVVSLHMTTDCVLTIWWKITFGAIIDYLGFVDFHVLLEIPQQQETFVTDVTLKWPVFPASFVNSFLMTTQIGRMDKSFSTVLTLVAFLSGVDPHVGLIQSS